MTSFQLACRIYSIAESVKQQVKELLIESDTHRPHQYGEYTTDEGEQISLSIVISNRYENSYGYLLKILIDQIVNIYDREKGKQVVRYYKEYEVQYLTEKPNFKDHVIIFGPKNIDNLLKKAIYFYLQKHMSKIPDFLRLLIIDLKGNIDSIMKQYPDLQHFCIKDIPDDRTKDVVVKGNQLEQTDIYSRFVINEDTSGDINFLGVSLQDGKIIYVGGDGSIYSRFYFKLDEKIRTIYDLYSKIKKINAFINNLDNYNT